MTYFLKGAIHIHTKCSDGTGDIDEISKSAKRAGLDWIIITDHNKAEIQEGIYNGVYVIVGEEISPQNNANHCMAYGLKEQINSLDNPEEFLHEIKQQGAISCICHPHESLERKNQYKPIRWEYDDFSLVDGVEIWNYFSNWTNIYDDKNLITQAYYYCLGYFTDNEPMKETLELWDRINFGIKEIKFALGGIDAHRIKVKKGIITLPVYPYFILFKTVINVIPSKERLSENFEEAKNFILNSIKTGRHYIMDWRRGKNIEAEFCAHNKRLFCLSGDKLELDEDSEITVKLPQKADIKLIKDGVVWLSENNTKQVDFKIKYSGKYRIEVYINTKAWIFTNPFVFLEKGEIKWT